MSMTDGRHNYRSTYSTNIDKILSIQGGILTFRSRATGSIYFRLRKSIFRLEQGFPSSSQKDPKDNFELSSATPGKHLFFHET